MLQLLHITTEKLLITSYLIISILLVLSCSDQKKETISNVVYDESSNQKIFKKIPSEHSQITFSNDLKENIETYDNVFNFDYFYNGAGVGVEDINNDGLLDIFFSANQVENKLYLNKGNLIFEDISDKAGINFNKKWSNGVTFVDINNDGWQDIYISQGGPNNRSNRNNLLYINNHDNTFTESAKEYGIDDAGISTQTAFFDYDKDGDLDCIVMNENELYGLDPISLLKAVKTSSETKYFNSSHFYKNIDGKYVDVTKEVGLENPIFGLGLCVSDINDDGYLDIYISSDYYLPDALYLNTKNGNFKNSVKELTQHISFYGMGLDIADINNDNLQDIFVLDMASSDHFRAKTLMASMSTDKFNYLTTTAGFQYQYMFNSLQLNLGENHYSNISQLTSMASSDWSWSVLMSDYDNDGLKDIFITNGYRKYALDNDFQNKVYKTKVKYKGNIPNNIKQQLYDEMPSESLSNLMYKNEGNLNFKEKANEWGLEELTFSNGAAQGDFDNDGDLDLIINNIDQKALLYKNNTVEQSLGNFLKVTAKSETSESFAKVTIAYDNKNQYEEIKRVRGYMSSQENAAHFGIGPSTNIDTVKIEWPSGKISYQFDVESNSTLTFSEKDASLISSEKSIEKDPFFIAKNAEEYNIDFKHKETTYDDFAQEILLPYKQSNTGPFTSKGDINGDGKEDLYIGGGSGQPGSLYVQGENGFIKRIPTPFQLDKGKEDAESVFFDFDNDNDLDLYVVSGGNEYGESSSYYADRLYLNDGKGNFHKMDTPILKSFPKSGKSVTIIDFDKDGDNDVLVGNRIIPHNYPKYSASILYENDNGILKNVTKNIVPELENFGLVNSIITTDFNNDGWQDFIAVGEWTPIGIFENKNGKFQRLSTKGTALDTKGWWFKVKETDVNNDGNKDYLIGNVGRNIKFTASEDKPFKIYSNDFDNDGINDVVLSKKYHETYVPVRGRECSSQQMPFIKEKFTTYNDFANATMEDIYGDKLKDSYSNEVTEFNSILLLNKGNNKFEKVTLPNQAQLFPTLAISLFDLNNDGFEDCVVSGNIYETEVETPRLDAISGLALISNGKDGYTPATMKSTGLYLKGNVKSMESIKYKDHTLLIAGFNNDKLRTFELTKN
ncbi:FG-GAP-like repeat-containing protein [uncultured Maribacter sp.]|uniref:VCBS repeat-containing protein n=1 Tax=uncultured Maribacter sp. TaxID=431308 RepID=UPI00261E3443|nr:FG-GAP-like repeat-containing protein [uncultured Maribacter sp.]